MRMHFSYTALGLALVAGAPAANAQYIDQPYETMVTRPAVFAPAPLVAPSATFVAEPVRTVETIETVRTVRPARTVVTRRVVRREVVSTRRTMVRERIIPRTVGAPTITADTDIIAPRPIYDQYLPPRRPIYDEYLPPRRIYNEYAPPAPLYDSVVAPDFGPVEPAVAMPMYRYVYEPGRILVIDTTTGIAISAIPR